MLVEELPQDNISAHLKTDDTRNPLLIYVLHSHNPPTLPAAFHHAYVHPYDSSRFVLRRGATPGLWTGLCISLCRGDFPRNPAIVRQSEDSELTTQWFFRTLDHTSGFLCNSAVPTSEASPMFLQPHPLRDCGS